MKKEDLISQCRYYGGEEVPPFQTGKLRTFWDIERVYVSSGGDVDKENASLYESAGGKKYPGIPYPLLITFFGAWNKSSYDTKKELPQFHSLIDEYLEAASEYYPKNKIPSK